MENFSKECKCCHELKTIDHFKKTRFGTHADVCTECAAVKRRDTLVKKRQQEALRKIEERMHNDARKSLLEDLNPRELMLELDRRGYKGNLQYTQTIDICNI